VAVLVPLAFWRFRRSHPHEALLFGLLSLEHLVFYASYGNWHGGSCWGPRFLLPVLPFLVLPLGALLERHDPIRGLTKALVVLGLLVQIPATLSNPHLFLRFVQENRIGDTVFYRQQPEDPLFSPSLCPVAGGYYQVASALSRWTTGASLTYPVAPAGGGRPASLASYDLIDVWWLNALHTGRLGSAAGAGMFAVILVLVSLGVLSARSLVQWAALPGRGPEPSPQCSQGDR
jgi:hypothetical protein